MKGGVERLPGGLQGSQTEFPPPVPDGTNVQVTAEFADAYVPGHLPNDNAQLAKKVRKKAAKEARRASRCVLC